MMPEGGTESEISPYIFVNDFALYGNCCLYDKYYTVNKTAL